MSMAAHRFYARSTCLLVENDSNLSMPERSLWHFDQLYAGGVQLKVKPRDGKSSNFQEGARSCFDLPKALPGHLTLLTAEVFEPLKLDTLVAASTASTAAPAAAAAANNGKSKSPHSSPSVRVELTPRTALSFVFQEYRVVLSIGLAESLFVVSPTSGRIAFDLVPIYIQTLLEQLVAPITLDGHIHFEPVIHLSVVATTPTRTFICLTHGRIVSKDTYQEVAKHISAQLYALVQRDSFRNVRQQCFCVFCDVRDILFQQVNEI